MRSRGDDVDVHDVDGDGDDDGDVCDDGGDVDINIGDSVDVDY